MAKKAKRRVRGAASPAAVTQHTVRNHLASDGSTARRIMLAARPAAGIAKPSHFAQVGTSDSRIAPPPSRRGPTAAPSGSLPGWGRRPYHRQPSRRPRVPTAPTRR